MLDDMSAEHRSYRARLDQEGTMKVTAEVLLNQVAPSSLQSIDLWHACIQDGA